MVALSSSGGCVLVALCSLVLMVAATSYQDCGSEGEILEMSITDCDIPPCIVERPYNYSIAITFVASKASSTLDTEIIATIGSTTNVPWPAPSACDLMGDKSCPILQGETYPFLMTMQVKPEFPQISVMLKVLLRDEAGGMQVCVELPLTVV